MPPADRDRDVMTSLPRSRPTRRSAKRGGPAPDAAAEPAAQPAAAARAKQKAAKPKTAAGPKAAPGTARAAAGVTPPPSGWATPKDDDRRGAPGRGELIGTAVQAVGELAQIGAAYGGRALRQALGRLPRP